MAANTNPIFEAVPTLAGVQVVNADGTNKKTVATGNTNGSRIDAVYISSSDTSSVTLNWYLTIGGTDYYIGDTVIAIGAGYTTVARADVMSTLSPVLGYVALPNSVVLKTAASVAVTSGKQVDIVAQGGDY